MRQQPSISATAGMGSAVDIESVTKGRESQVDVKKLAKAENKIKAKMEKRARRTEYESSRLIDAANQQVRYSFTFFFFDLSLEVAIPDCIQQKDYEKLFLEVNSLQSLSQSKGKIKDVHLENIDVSFGSNKILTDASLTLAEGRFVQDLGSALCNVP
jgi:ATP-binding cassette subfamily F protein 3